MITIENLNNITIDDALIDADIVTAAQWAFANGKATELLTALTAYEQQLIASSATPEINTVDTAQIADLQSQLQSAQQTIEQQRSQLSLYVIKDWGELQDDLLNAGLDDLFALVTQIAQATPNPPQDKTSLQAQALKLIADVAAAVRAKDRISVINAYQAIFGTNDKPGFVQKIGGLNPDRAPELVAAIQSTMPQLQAVLDSDKYKIPKNLLAFVP